MYTLVHFSIALVLAAEAGTMTRKLIKPFSCFVFFLFLSSLFIFPLLQFFQSQHMDRQTLLSLFGALGSWLGGIAAHLLALVLAPVFNKVREKLFPPPPPAPNLASHEPSNVALARSMDKLERRAKLLTELLVDPDPAMEFGVTIRALPRRRRRGHADPAVAPPE